MKSHNKIALGIAGLSGALATGTEVKAQIIDVTVSTNFLTRTGINQSGSNQATFFGPSSTYKLAINGSLNGGVLKDYFLGGGKSLANVSFAVSGSSTAKLFKPTSVISSFVKSGSWKSKLAIFFKQGEASLTNGSGSQYFGFRVSTGPKSDDYGWIDLHHDIAGQTVTFSVTGIAYAENGASIYPGQTQSVPEPASASLLALGAMSLGARGVRRMKQARAAAKGAV